MWSFKHFDLKERPPPLSSSHSFLGIKSIQRSRKHLSKTIDFFLCPRVNPKTSSSGTNFREEPLRQHFVALLVGTSAGMDVGKLDKINTGDRVTDEYNAILMRK